VPFHYSLNEAPWLLRLLLLLLLLLQVSVNMGFFSDPAATQVPELAAPSAIREPSTPSSSYRAGKQRKSDSRRKSTERRGDATIPSLAEAAVMMNAASKRRGRRSSSSSGNNNRSMMSTSAPAITSSTRRSSTIHKLLTTKSHTGTTKEVNLKRDSRKASMERRRGDTSTTPDNAIPRLAEAGTMDANNNSKPRGRRSSSLTLQPLITRSLSTPAVPTKTRRRRSSSITNKLTSAMNESLNASSFFSNLSQSIRNNDSSSTNDNNIMMISMRELEEMENFVRHVKQADVDQRSKILQMAKKELSSSNK
jgi:hypothetical protein